MPADGVDETHDPALASWVPSAAAGHDFPIQNLPLGVFERQPADRGRAGVAIGDEILDLAACADAGLLPAPLASACREETLNALLALGATARRDLRRTVSALLRAGTPVRAALLVPQSGVRLRVPVGIGDYTDFYASVHHATRVGALLRPEAPLLPSYKHVPIAYHGRASSIVASGTPVRRPSGQTLPEGAASPSFGPSRRLDYEVEVGFFVGPGNPLGTPIPIGEAEEHLAGACLLDDWSARDLQKWEYQPLGPFLAKSFATTISPWIVTTEALAPFRGPLAARAPGDPAPLAYLSDARESREGGYDIRVEALLQSEAMRAQGLAPFRLGAASLLDMYWTPGQMLTHHASNGCNLRPGDLLASGTVSGPDLESAGCLLERTSGGRVPLALPTGETRRFLEDGDEVVLRARCERPGFAPIGFGECRGRVISAH
jgi:fumarylacetoacetase